ncbi:MAG: sialidase family protein [Armatimonadota bacterium]
MNDWHAKALEFKKAEVYFPSIRPGYTGWASIYQFGNGDIGIAFEEIRRGTNPNPMRARLEDYNAVGMPYRYGPALNPNMDKNLLNEYVYIKSGDGGETWEETGRCPASTRHYFHEGFPDGRMIRTWSGMFCLELGRDRFNAFIEESADGGNTWTPLSRLSDFFPFRIKKLSSGILIASGHTYSSWGPGGIKSTRTAAMPGVIYDMQSCFFASKDNGRTWDGPHYVLPDIPEFEFDFVELPDGSLLFVNSDVQSSRPMRQIVRRTETGYINGPAMEIHRGAPSGSNIQGGFIPESIVITPDGLLIGARRGKPYSCSNDLGENWYEIADTPVCGYQPMATLLPDGKFISVWHSGHDCMVGEEDMYIGTHSFRVDEHLPKSTKLTLERELAEGGSKYVNVFMARLTANGEAASGKLVNFRIKPTWSPEPEGIDVTISLDETPDVRSAVTDSQGIARIELKDKEEIPDIHHAYAIDAVFNPDCEDNMQACRSPQISAYAMTPARNCPANYLVYNAHGLIMVTPDTAKRFPELTDAVSRLDGRKEQVSLDEWVNAVGSSDRAAEIIGFLTENHILIPCGENLYRWYRAVHSGHEIIKGVRICDAEEYYL